MADTGHKSEQIIKYIAHAVAKAPISPANTLVRTPIAGLAAAADSLRLTADRETHTPSQMAGALMLGGALSYVRGAAIETGMNGNDPATLNAAVAGKIADTAQPMLGLSGCADAGKILNAAGVGAGHIQGTACAGAGIDMNFGLKTTAKVGVQVSLRF